MHSLIQKFNHRFQLNLNILIILCLVAQHSFVVKFAALLALCAINLSSLKNFRAKEIPVFYLFIIATELLKFIFMNPSYGLPHVMQFAVGIIYWAAALAVCWILYDTVNKGPYIHRSIHAFTILNVAFSVFQLIKICVHEHTLNPYNTGHNHPYGISSGDLISGIFQGVHLTNAFVSLLLLIYYIHKNELKYVFLSLISLLLTGSNYATIIFFIAAGIYFFSNRLVRQKIILAAVTLIIALFYWLVTPLNAEYMFEKILHTSVTLSNSRHEIDAERLNSEKEFKEIELADTLNPYDVNGSTSKKLIVKNTGRGDTIFNFVKQPGKTRAYYQTKNFILSSVPHFLFGSGLGGFSSKLAFNSSGVMEGSALGKYLPAYETEAFGKNHKALYAYLKTQHIMFQSESNRPFSVYNQLLGEYGVVGCLLFLVFYLWYFVKRVRKNTYALPVIVAMLFMINIDYFIEALSVFFFFELLLFIDIKQKTAPDEL